MAVSPPADMAQGGNIELKSTGYHKKGLGAAANRDKLSRMEIEPLCTAEGQGVPTVRQQSVFVENRVGQLLRLTRLFDQTDVRIVAVSVVYSVDCAICRLITDDPDRSYDVLTQAGFPVSETELLVVSLPHGKRALLHTWATLLGGEVNIHYVYPLLIQPKGLAAIAVQTDNMEQAVKLLAERNFDVLDQEALRDARYQ